MSAHTHAAGWVSSQGHYAGSVSRFLAYAIDLAVIYAWDARAARLRFLAREAEVGAAGGSRLPADTEGDDGRTGRLSSDVPAA